MMLCLIARRYLAAAGGGPADDAQSASRRRALAAHLASCAGCRAEQARLARLTTLLADAAPALRMPADQFTGRLMATIEARKRGSVPAPARGPAALVPGFLRGEPLAWTGFRPAAVLPALCLMVAAGVMALYLSGEALPGDAARSAGAPVAQAGSVDDYQDSLRPPPEVPFSVEQDLVGRRRGTIPLTTYVLEPAPKDAPILLASF